MEGETAFDFCLNDQDGREHCLSTYRGSWVLLYFYPKDDTPGCTKEACSLGESWNDFKSFNTIVLGVSADSQKSHKNFQEKYKLPFILLSDENKIVVKKYAVWKEKSMFGKKYMGINRESFLINPEGIIIKHYSSVKPENHAVEVLEYLRNNK